MDKEKTLTNRQLAAIKWSMKRGIELAEKHPEVAELYRQGATKRQIATEFQDVIREMRTDLTQDSVNSTVHYAIRHLIPEEEREELGRKHVTQGIENMMEQRLGIFGMSKEEKFEIGRTSAAKQIAGRIGIWALSFKERQQMGKEAARSRGKDPISDDEKEYILILYDDPKFQYTSGPKKGLPNFELITTEMNQKFGTSRTKTAFHVMGSLARRKRK